jgi:hypothetical protein
MTERKAALTFSNGKSDFYHTDNYDLRSQYP